MRGPCSIEIVSSRFVVLYIKGQKHNRIVSTS
jgi:hypothetical protein